MTSSSDRRAAAAEAASSSWFCVRKGRSRGWIAARSPGGGSLPRRVMGYVWHASKASTRWYAVSARPARAPGRAASRSVKARRPASAHKTQPGESPPSRKLAMATRITSGGAARMTG
eukprot:13944998-Alexandrium_andersonii.AAC.1